MAFLIIFLVSLSAATIFPVSSEATLLYYLSEGYVPLAILLTAGTGNVLGSVINYLIGKKGIDYLLTHQKISGDRIKRSEIFFDKYGALALLLSWVPVIGDPLTLVAGALHFNFRKFLLIVSIAKIGRYLLLIWGFQNLI